jgi:hypothetical protein
MEHRRGVALELQRRFAGVAGGLRRRDHCLARRRHGVGHEHKLVRTGEVHLP